MPRVDLHSLQRQLSELLTAVWYCKLSYLTAAFHLALCAIKISTAHAPLGFMWARTKISVATIDGVTLADSGKPDEIKHLVGLSIGRYY